MDKRRSIPPPSEGGPGRIPRGHAEEPTGALEPRRRKPRTDTPGGHHREHPTAPAEGGVRDARTPASGTGRAVEHHRRCWHCYADARYWHRRALSTTCMGYQHRRALYPPRGVNSPLTMSTTPSRCRQRAPVRGALEPPRARNPPTPNNARPCGARHRPASPLGESPGLVPLPPVTHTRTPIYETSDAHNGLIPPLCATPCFLIPSLVCDTKKNARPGR